MKTFGFIGAGNMGGALATALCKNIPAENVYLTDLDKQKVEALGKSLKCNVSDITFIAGQCDCIFLGVKPQTIDLLLEELKPILSERQEKPVIVSMAAGVSISHICQKLVTDCPVIRIMPNIPVKVGQGVLLAANNASVSEEALAEFMSAMSAVGLTESIEEKLIDAASAVSGCGPAFVYLFIEALADGGVECGVSRALALRLAAQTVLGAAQTVLEDNQHPARLKDAVCSPGGTTIAGVHALENGGFRGTAMQAVKAAYEKTLSLSK